MQSCDVLTFADLSPSSLKAKSANPSKYRNRNREWALWVAAATVSPVSTSKTTLLWWAMAPWRSLADHATSAYGFVLIGQLIGVAWACVWSGQNHQINWRDADSALYLSRWRRSNRSAPSSRPPAQSRAHTDTQTHTQLLRRCLVLTPMTVVASKARSIPHGRPKIS